MKPISIVILLLLAASCNNMQKGNIDVYINPQDTGWYFIEIDKDTAAMGPAAKEVRFDSAAALPAVKVHNFADYNFRVFSHQGEKISATIKMPAFVYHTSGHQLFRFYNPSPASLANDLNWNPTGSHMEQLREKSIVLLNQRLNARYPQP